MSLKKTTLGSPSKYYRRPPAGAKKAPSRGREDPIGNQKGDESRITILDAALGCFADVGFSGTNMSLIARRSRMTRGRIQYYFPTLDDLLREAIQHLVIEWRKKYFGLVSRAVGPSARFETGIAELWNLMQDPLHAAKQELEINARTNPQISALLQQYGADDDEASVQAVKQAYPELAQFGDAALRRARNFTLAFMNGLSMYRFRSGDESGRKELLDMLRGFLLSYWRGVGAEGLYAEAVSPQAPAADAAVELDNERRARALELIRRAAALLSADPTLAPRGGAK